MENNFQNVGIIILAAGRGKRLGCTDMPKVLCKINNRPIVSYILEQLEIGGIFKKKIVLVVGFQKDKVKEVLGNDYIYAIQDELLGTAHAAHIGEKQLPYEIKNFLIINGDDSAFYTFATLDKFVGRHKENNNALTLLTSEKENPQGLGRIIRDEYGNVITIREKENLKPGDENIKEISTGTFCFKRIWFNNVYPTLKPIAGLGEYGLPSFVKEALLRKDKFMALKLENPDEWFGINTSSQLLEADQKKKLLK